MLKRILLFILFMSFVIHAQNSVIGKLQNEITELIDKVMPSIARIQCIGKVRNNNHLLRRLKQFKNFHMRWSKRQKLRKFLLDRDRGIGIIIDKQGHILTTDFVKKKKKIIVTLFDNRRFKAEIKGIFCKKNIALLKINADNLQPVIIGNSDKIKPGNLILSIGNPYGIGFCNHIGIINSTPKFIKGKTRLLITTPIYPGDKGGPVFNCQGELIGLINGVLKHSNVSKKRLRFYVKNFAFSKAPKQKKKFNHMAKKRMKKNLDDKFFRYKLDADKNRNKKRRHSFHSFPVPIPFFQKRLRGKHGLTLALPINPLKPIIEAMKNKKKIVHGWLGIRVTYVTPDLNNKLPNHFFLRIEEVKPNSPAQKAGLKQLDLIVKFAGRTFFDMMEFKKMVENKLGKTTITVLRKGELLTLDVDIKGKTYQ